MSEREKIVEVMANALRDDGCGLTIEGRRAFCDDQTAPADIRREPGDCICRHEAPVVLAALEAAGYAVVERSVITSRVTTPGITHEQEPYVAGPTPDNN